MRRIVRRRRRILVATALAAAFAGCRDEAERDSRAEEAASARALSPAPPPDPARRELFFGDLHVHTAWSFDAFDHGVRALPTDAYRFARGEPIPHAAGGTISLAGPPLDFIAITDHAEYLGVATAALREQHVLHRQPVIQALRRGDPARFDEALAALRRTSGMRRPFPALVADEVLVPAWQEVVAAADAHDRPGQFTALVGFEYTSNPDSQNLHRNVLFRGAKVPPRPFSAFDSQDPEDLWDWMDAARAKGDDLLAIPHNSNGSNGLMFAETRLDGTPIDAAWAEQRLRNEPIVELIQIKGQSETTPALSPDDGWADFEVVPWRTLDPERPSRDEGSYVRDAIRRGLALEARLGVDPFAVGVVGSSDGHNGASPVVESSYFGKLGRTDGSPTSRLGRAAAAAAAANDPAAAARARGRPDPTTGMRRIGVSPYWSAAGLAGVWATENSRAAIFDALRRRESFATSGPRIRIRVFATAGGERVAMGGTLRVPTAATSPRFEITAQQDPQAAALERVQVVKLWWKSSGERGEQIIDVACWNGARPAASEPRCPDPVAPPDPRDCALRSGAGARELVADWRDPAFDAGAAAAYQVRVLQVPTCRWSSFDAKALGIAPPAELPATLQERAITSPIWIRPALAAD